MFVENDPNYCVDITSTKDGKFITVNSNSRTSSEEGTYLFQFFSSFSIFFLLRRFYLSQLKTSILKLYWFVLPRFIS